MERGTAARAVTLAVVLALLIPSVSAFGSESGTFSAEEITSQAVGERPGTTVITTDAHGGGRIVAFGPSGDVLYYNETYPYYHDVDPVAGTRATVEYVASAVVDRADCPATRDCLRSVYERLNLTTGEVTRVYARIRPKGPSRVIHDIDRIDSHRLLVAEISEPDRVYIYNTTSGVVEWGWNVQADYPIASGGKYPGDWTHLNDVEYTDDGYVMVSLRNQDQVVFVHPEEGLDERRTLGAEDDRDVLYEQHNPDYIPRANGGPAVVIADSENSRLVEYQRTGDGWERTWIWYDATMQWPRDVDRLPNGHTLVAGTHGDRVFELDRTGEIVWSVSFPGPYDAERLSTPSESGGGPSATAAELGSREVTLDDDADSASTLGTTLRKVKDLLPSIVLNGLLFLLPPWVTPLSAIALVLQAGILFGWAVVEAHHRYAVSLVVPVRVRRR